MKTITLQLLRTASREVVPDERIVPLIVHIGDLPIRPWFGVVQKLAVDVLQGTSFIDRCTRRILPS